ncbi:MAG TPA: sensor histidine kinase [Ktedonobacterales bacterium]
MRTVRFMRENSPATASRRLAFPLWLIWIVWLPFFIPPATALIQTRPAPALLIVSFAGAALFFALYLWTTWRCAEYLANASPRELPSRAKLWAPIASMLALSVLLTLLVGPTSGWGALLIYTSTCAAGWLPLRQAAAAIAGMVAFTLIGLSLHGGIASAISPVAFIVVPGVVVVALVRAIGMNQRLRATREELTRVAAATEERLRIARDLHDLLGHTLSLIALKSELAGRLVLAAPDRAATEMRDVESVARHALQEVRQAVSAYRQPTLASELRAAREILTAAGIVYAEVGVEAGMRDAPPAVEAVLSWAVREGVTNVIRHSQARHCTIQLSHGAGQCGITVTDDGRGVVPTACDDGRGIVAAVTSQAGSGLAGLAERVAALGGDYAAGPRAEGGFRLAIALPLTSGAPARTAAAQDGVEHHAERIGRA